MDNIFATKFNFGQVVMTPGFETLAGECLKTLVPELLQKHGNLDQGELSDNDQQANQYAVSNDYRIFNAYKVHGQKVYIITEYDRSVTTLLLPEEY